MRRPILAALCSHARSNIPSRAPPPLAIRHASSSPITHTDIPSFLRYAYLVGLNPTTTVFNGTLYEYTVLAALARLPGVSLTRIGGKDDAGIDLQGFWELPRLAATDSSTANDASKIKLPMIVQCKFGEKSWKGPQYVRELEGALANHPIDALGILASVRDMTPGMRRQMLASRRALGFVKVTPLAYVYRPNFYESESATIQLLRQYKMEYHDKEENYNDNDSGGSYLSFRLTGQGGLLQQFTWNEVANRSLGGFGITARYISREHGAPSVPLDDADVEQAGDDPLEQEITLMWNGVPLSKAA
ncbi:hypothetical protein Dda_7946 [Drechslerella dactyloides]|uniref:Required for respiratory growth protein 7, mitochondrial n=1 Tax=Drechslerella dactyloides TaxID=74499 RepID=A0AAD6NG98_DREDA|nr:hypothetical protein Dda_7946 [Drechslerella dactyloides]